MFKIISITKHLLTWSSLAWEGLGLSHSPFWWVLKGIFFHPMAPLPSGNSQKQSCCPELLSCALRGSWALLFGFRFFGGCDVIIPRGLRRCRVLQENKTGGRDLNVKWKTQADLILPLLPPPFALKGSSWLYTTGISFIEKKESGRSS